MRADVFVNPLRALALAALLVAGMPAAAQQPAAVPGAAPTVAADPQLEADVMELSHKLRCLVCQNQSIAESNAPLALDLRDQVREQLAAGRSKDDVIDYLVARYGDFVLYDPPFKATTLLLWGGPVLLLVGGAGWLGWRLRRRQGELAAVQGLSEAERRRARELLAGDAKQSPSESPESRS
ncbi:cytochrome c-type biogenesis protein [Thauera sp.]|uniref:cytochrome c-type biogenesis protein n=1 Tax=Thauera sp. TaxID=1905334 RepID=UPI0039E45BA0